MKRTLLQNLLVLAARRSAPEGFDKLAREEITTRTKVWKLAGVKAE